MLGAFFCFDIIMISLGHPFPPFTPVYALPSSLSNSVFFFCFAFSCLEYDRVLPLSASCVHNTSTHFEGPVVQLVLH